MNKFTKIENFEFAMGAGFEHVSTVYRVAPNTLVARAPRNMKGWQILQESTGLRVQGGFRTRDAARTAALLVLESAQIAGIPIERDTAVALLNKAIADLRNARAPFKAIDWT